MDHLKEFHRILMENVWKEIFEVYPYMPWVFLVVTVLIIFIIIGILYASPGA